MPYDYHLWSRDTPDERDDHEQDDTGIIGIGSHGRLGLNKYSDNDYDDEDMDCQTIHDRRNVTALPSAPDPYFKRGSRR